MTPVPPLGPVFIGLNLIRGKNPHVVKPEMGQDAQQTNKQTNIKKAQQKYSTLLQT